MPKVRTLNVRQEAFAAACLAEPTLTAAAIRAGYAPRSAYSQGSRLNANPAVRARIEELRRVQAAGSGYDREDLSRRLARQICMALIAGKTAVAQQSAAVYVEMNGLTRDEDQRLLEAYRRRAD